MLQEEKPSLEERYKDALLLFSSFALANTGILRGQTILKIEEYSLPTLPWQFGMKRGILAGAFSAGDISFFQRFKGSLAGLALAVQRPDAREQEKIYCRCQVSTLGPMKEREGIGLIVVDWKPLHPDLSRMLGEHFALVDRLKNRAEALRDRSVAVSPENARSLGYNNFAAMNSGGAQQKIALYSISSRRLDFLMPLNSPEQLPGAEVSFTLYFLKYRFSVSGCIEASERLPSGVQRVRASIAFSPELAHILEEYFAARP